MAGSQSVRVATVQVVRDPPVVAETNRVAAGPDVVWDTVFDDEFEWDYQGAGPRVLAEAILADRLGFNPDQPVTMAFAREVVAKLDSEFELTASDVDDWIARIGAASGPDPTRPVAD